MPRHKPNPAIGEIVCPMPGCGEKCAIKKFAARAKLDTGRRAAGKLYFDCPTHGRFGFDGKATMQDYILENGDIWGDTSASEIDSEAHPVSQAAQTPVHQDPTPAPSPSRQGPTSSPATSSKAKTPWTFFG